MTEDYGEDWEQLDEKVLMVQILVELQQVRAALTDASDDSGGESAYRCRRCNETVPADAREGHALDAHKAPPDMIDGMYERV